MATWIKIETAENMPQAMGPIVLETYGILLRTFWGMHPDSCYISDSYMIRIAIRENNQTPILSLFGTFELL